MTLRVRVALGLVAGVFLLVPFLIGAAEYRAAEQLSIAGNVQVSEDLYIAGGNITTAAVVSGDLVAVGGNVLVNGSTAGDLIVAGGTLTIPGEVGDDLRTAGGTITISGKIGDDLVVGGGQVNISGAGVGGDVLAGVGSLVIDAPVAGDLVIGGGEVFVNSTIGGDLRFAGEKLTLGSSALIQGDLIYTSPNEAKLQEGAIVQGDTQYEQAEDVRGIAERGLLAFVTLAAIGKFLSLLASALVVGLAFSKYSIKLVEAAAESPWYEIGRGFVAFVMLPVFSIALLFTVIGIPLGFLGLALFVAMVILASIVAPITLGSLVYRRFAKREYVEVSWKTILLGVVLYDLIGLIPFVGFLATIAFMLLAVGSIVKVKIDIVKKLL